jgi:hypothetical protein
VAERNMPQIHLSRRLHTPCREARFSIQVVEGEYRTAEHPPFVDAG